MLCLLTGSSGGGKRKDLVSPMANSGPHGEKSRSAQVSGGKMGQWGTRSVLLLVLPVVRGCVVALVDGSCAYLFCLSPAPDLCGPYLLCAGTDRIPRIKCV